METNRIKRGFLLLEVLVSLLFMTISMFILIQYQSNSHQTQVAALKRFDALSLGQSLLDRMLIDPSFIQQKKVIQNDITCSWEVKELEQFPDILMITMKIEWPLPFRPYNQVRLITALIK